MAGVLKNLMIAGAGLAMACAGTGCASAAPSAASSSTAEILRPVSIAKVNDLDFATLSVTTGGTATIDASNPNNVTTTGGVTRVGGAPQAALFRIQTTRAALILIRLPTAPTILTRAGGTETMRVDNWNMDGSALRLILGAGPIDLHVGATLSPAANQADGTYSGSFTVTVDYL